MARTFEVKTFDWKALADRVRFHVSPPQTVVSVWTDGIEEAGWLRVARVDDFKMADCCWRHRKND